MDIPTQLERIDFWEHSYARSSFVQARLFVELLLSTDPPLHSTSRKAFTVAILGVYCRPFKQRKQVRLSEDIVPAQHRETHGAMIELRDKVIAHRDLDGPITDLGFINQLELHFRSNELTVNTISPSMPNEIAKKTLPLIDFLVEEMDLRVSAFVTRYLRMPQGDAVYAVSLDKAPNNWLIPINRSV